TLVRAAGHFSHLSAYVAGGLACASKRREEREPRTSSACTGEQPVPRRNLIMLGLVSKARNRNGAVQDVDSPVVDISPASRFCTRFPSSASATIFADPVPGTALANGWAFPRRPDTGRCGRAQPAERLLHGCGERGCLEVGGLRSHLEPHIR